MTADARRHLPAVDRLLRDPEVAALLVGGGRNAVVQAVRETLAAVREGRSGRPDSWAEAIRERLQEAGLRSLRPVLNATGVVLHTNLGRAPLCQAAVDSMVAVASGYASLEYDLAAGARGQRADHCRELLASLSGAQDGLAVNNAAGALVLALNAFAGGGRVLISRGELIEIGGSFRIPDIMARSGALLAEVGTTNRTHLKDYEQAAAGVAAILTVHRSNFEQKGFVTSPEPAELSALARRLGIPYLYDVGGGLLADLSRWGLTSEPRVAEAVGVGADLVIFSGDKLLGGPQAGCMVGTATAVARVRDNPLARALRADKLTLAALEATLSLYRAPDVAIRDIPVLAMLTRSKEDLRHQAEVLAAACPARLGAQLVEGESAVGGGSFPGAVLPTTLVSLDPGPLGANGLATRLRLGDPPLVARVEGGRLLLDPRTLFNVAPAVVGGALAAALAE